MLDTGETDLPTVVCLHSLFLDPTMFDALVIAGRGQYRFIRPEFLGQASRVDEVDGPVTMDECADDLIDTLERLGLTSVTLIGQSMGGDVAIRVSAKRPSLVEAIVFLASSARAEMPELLEDHRLICDRVEREGFTPELTDITMGIMFGSTTLTAPDRARLAATWRERISELSPRLHWAIRGVVERDSAVDSLDEVKVRTLVINGLEDLVRPDEWSNELVEHIPWAERLRVQQAGHSVILEEPTIVVPRILEFLAAG